VSVAGQLVAVDVGGGVGVRAVLLAVHHAGRAPGRADAREAGERLTTDRPPAERKTSSPRRWTFVLISRLQFGGVRG
jgi:hypothetical protein